MATKMPNMRAVRDFLERAFPTMLGTVGTVRADGSPHVVPVWYRYDSGANVVTIWTHEARAWVRNAARDDRVAFSVQEDGPPYGAVLMRGRAEILTGDGQDITDEIRRITERYIEAPGVDEYIEGWLHLRTIVSIRPEKIVAWGKGY